MGNTKSLNTNRLFKDLNIIPVKIRILGNFINAEEWYLKEKGHVYVYRYSLDNVLGYPFAVYKLIEEDYKQLRGISLSNLYKAIEDGYIEVI